MTEYRDAFNEPIKENTFYMHIESERVGYLFKRNGDWILEHSNGEQIVNPETSLRKMRPTTADFQTSKLESEIDWINSKK